MKVVANNIMKIELLENDPLLSGILDMRSLQKNIIEGLKLYDVWNEVNESINIIDLPEGLEEYMRNYMNKNERHNIPENVFESELFDLFVACRNLASSIIRTKKIQMYSKHEEIHESTWSHDLANPIIQLLFYNLPNMSYQW